MGTRCPLPGVKRPRREADHSLATRAEVKNSWNYTSTPKYAFTVWCSIKAQGQLYLYITGPRTPTNLCFKYRDIGDPSLSQRLKSVPVIFLFCSQWHGTHGISCTSMYPKVSGLTAWSKNCKWYSSLPRGAVVSLFCESVQWVLPS